MTLVKLSAIIGCVCWIAGCKSGPAYVGTYRMVLTAEMQAESAQLAKLKGQAAATRIEDLLSAQTFTLNADGTGEIKNSVVGFDAKGTYTLEGDRLIFIDSAGSRPGHRSEFAYDANAGTLSSPAGTPAAERIAYKKE